MSALLKSSSAPTSELMIFIPVDLLDLLPLSPRARHLLEREDARVPGENPRIHGENMQTPWRNQDLLAARQQC
ncbi:hypothetical protein CHARACLAT_006953 [Characodon lateralis]|uniref:Uncharacterized protein n=1 Tax=Characodon lateralis TaxID=208331 RepID=A0ABU7EKU0_9TELE|nr:hypothetical protein [Characodon lateralis]